MVQDHSRTHQNWCFRKKLFHLWARWRLGIFFVNSRKNLNWLFFVACVLVQWTSKHENYFSCLRSFQLYFQTRLTWLKSFTQLDKLYIRIAWLYSNFLMIMRRSWQTSLNRFGKKLSSLVGHISYQGVFYIIFTNLYKIRHGQMFSKIKFYTRKNYTQKPSPTHSKIIYGL